jgi:hypothetical protein
MSEQRQSYLRSNTDREEAFAEYEALKAEGDIEKAVIIVKRRDGSFAVHGQMATPLDMGELVYLAASAITATIAAQSEKQPDEAAPKTERSGRTSKPYPMTVAAAWAKYEVAFGLYEGELPKPVRDEIRGAFYAGGIATHNLFMDAAAEPDGPARISAIREEMSNFMDDLERKMQAKRAEDDH